MVERTENNVSYKKIKRALADGSYNSKETFDYLNSKKIEAGIKIRKNTSPRARESFARGKYTRKVKKLGYEE